jgi:hypothetical protein
MNFPEYHEIDLRLILLSSLCYRIAR